MQYEQFGDGRREDLPRPSIDTGMGLERIGAVLQGVHDNYDTDLMRALIEASAQASGTEPDGPGAAPSPGDRRSSALDLVSDRRRGDAVE
jgi:alanyl-tRNA synthetase